MEGKKIFTYKIENSFNASPLAESASTRKENGK